MIICGGRSLGALSAISLPLGSLLGLSWQPSNKITAGLTAFGGGALIAALSIELVAPTALKLTQSGVSPEDLHHNVQALLSLIAGAVVGGGLFLTLDAIINSKGGFLRKTATTIAYFSGRKAARRRAVINHLAESELIRHVPIEVVEEMVDHVSSQEIESGSQLFAEGDEGDAIYFIETGEITLSHGDEAFAQLDAGEVLGEIALITGAARTATATAKIDTRLLRLEKSDFDELRQQYSDLEEAAQIWLKAVLKNWSPEKKDRAARTLSSGHMRPSLPCRRWLWSQRLLNSTRRVRSTMGHRWQSGWESCWMAYQKVSLSAQPLQPDWRPRWPLIRTRSSLLIRWSPTH